MSEALSVGLIGAGAMGGALFRGWIAQGVLDAGASAIFDPHAPAEIVQLAEGAGVAVNPDHDALAPAILVLAVKPQIAAGALARFDQMARGACALSVMAGKSIAAIAAALGGAPRVARAMPNLPAALGVGVTGLYAPPSVDMATAAALERLLRAVGDVVRVESEDAIDAITAISGSGPAYFFRFAEALQDAARELGFDADTAARLARGVLKGAGAMMTPEAPSLSALREAVTSPGGTTEAALAALDADDALKGLVSAAARAAARRAGELTD